MATESIIAASAAILGGVVTKTLDHFFSSKNQKNTARREFLHEISSLSNRSIMAYDQYLNSYSDNDPVTYDTASRCRSRTPYSDVRKYNTNRPDVISDELISELQEWQSIAWKLDEFDMPSRSEWDEQSDGTEYLELMTELNEKSEEVNMRAISRLC